jgi:ABC-type Fe3+ transport system permease subunit
MLISLRLNSWEYFWGAMAFALTSIPYGVLVLAFINHVFRHGRLPDLFTSRTLDLINAGLILALVVAAGAVVVSIGVLVLLWRIKAFWLRMLILMTVGLLFCLSPVIHLIGWQSLPGFAMLPPMWAAALVLTWQGFPVVLLLLLVGLLSLEKQVVAATLMVCPPGRVLRRMVLPHLWPVMAYGAIVMAVLTFCQMEVPGLVGYAVYPEEFLSRVILEDDMGRLLWSAVPFAIASLAAAGLFLVIYPKSMDRGWQRNGLDLLDRLVAGWKWEAVAALCAVVVMLAPVLLLFNIQSADGYLEENIRAMATSLSLGMISVGLAMIAAYLLVDAFVLLPKPWRILLTAVFCWQLLLPGALLALAMKSLFHFHGFGWLLSDNLLLVLTHGIRLVPYAVLLTAGFRWFDTSSVDGDGCLFGVSWLRRKQRIQLPGQWRWMVMVGASFGCWCWGSCPPPYCWSPRVRKQRFCGFIIYCTMVSMDMS